MDRSAEDFDTTSWPGFRVVVAQGALGRVVEQPPNSEGQRAFVGLHPLQDGEGRTLGLFAVTGQADQPGQVVCVVRWNPEVTTEQAARGAFERLLAD